MAGCTAAQYVASPSARSLAMPPLASAPVEGGPHLKIGLAPLTGRQAWLGAKQGFAGALGARVALTEGLELGIHGGVEAVNAYFSDDDPGPLYQGMVEIRGHAVDEDWFALDLHGGLGAGAFDGGAFLTVELGVGMRFELGEVVDFLLGGTFRVNFAVDPVTFPSDGVTITPVDSWGWAAHTALSVDVSKAVAILAGFGLGFDDALSTENNPSYLLSQSVFAGVDISL